MTAAEKAAEKAKQEAAQGAAPDETTGQAGLDLQTASTQDLAGALLEPQTPEWVAELLESHKAVLESNQAVIEALDRFHEGVAEFKNDSGDFVKSLVQEFGPKKEGETSITKTHEPEFNPYAKYEVVSGFAEKDDMSRKYEAGKDVTHFGEARIKALLALGLVTEVEPDIED